MTDVLTALVVRLKRRAIRADAKGEVGLATDLLKAVALINELSARVMPPRRFSRASARALDLAETPNRVRP